MSRGRDWEEPRQDEEDLLTRAGQTPGALSQGAGGGDSGEVERTAGETARPSACDQGSLREDAMSRVRESFPGRHRTYHLSADERETLAVVGAFRTVQVEDLERHRYGGNRARLEQDVARLVGQQLMVRRTARVGRGGTGKLTVVSLTREGRRLLERNAATSGQAYYAGFVKPNEVAHDAAIYRMYQAEVARIERGGGKVRRVILDYELKRKVYSPLAKVPRTAPDDYARRQQEVAAENGLTVVDGRVALPDLRLEVETREGDLDRVDLELATEHYKNGQVAAKARAGFTIYAAGPAAARMSAVLEEREITAGVLSL